MNKILILYPSLFMCYSKFRRKITNVVKNLNNYSITTIHDYNGFIKKFSCENFINLEIAQDIEKDITHAIVFDDNSEFTSEINILKKIGIPLRVVNIKITRVINIKKNTEFKYLKSTKDYEYIGRGSYWGNPYSIYEEGEDREVVLQKFKYDFENDKFPNKEKNKVYELAGKKLGCFCKPLSCHGDILAEFLNKWDDGN